jgi:hypothetical protein
MKTALLVLGAVGMICVVGCMGLFGVAIHNVQKRREAERLQAAEKPATPAVPTPVRMVKPRSYKGHIEPCFAAVDYATESELIRFCTRKDQRGVRELIARGKAFWIKEQMPVTILEKGLMQSKVRIEGGILDGQVVCTASEFVHEE